MKIMWVWISYVAQVHYKQNSMKYARKQCYVIPLKFPMFEVVNWKGLGFRVNCLHEDCVIMVQCM